MADRLKASNYPEWDEFISQAKDSYIMADLEKLKKMYPNKNIDEQFVRTYSKYNLVKDLDIEKLNFNYFTSEDFTISIPILEITNGAMTVKKPPDSIN